MKKINIHQYFSGWLLMACVVLTVFSCIDDEFPVDKSYERMFRPYTITVKAVEATSAEVVWAVIKGAENYVIEVSNDSLIFENILKTIEYSAEDIPSGSTSVGVTLTSLVGETTYSVRVKVTSKKGIPESEYVMTTFRTRGEQILSQVGPSDKTSNSVTIKWPMGEEVTHIKLLQGGVVQQEVQLTSEEKEQGQKVITGLNENTTYTVEIYNTVSNKRGFVTFTTYSSAPPAETVVYLTEEDTLEIQNILNECTTSSITLVLPGGLTFRHPDDVAFTIKADLKAINFYGLPGDEMAEIKLKEFRFASAVDMTAINFDNIKLTGYDAGADYCFNPSTVTGYVNDITFANCSINNFRGVLRARGEITINNFTISNSVVTNIKGYGLVTMDTDSKPLVDNIVLENSTFNGMEIFIQSRFRNTNSVVFKNCTFYDMVNSGRYFVDYNGTTFGPSIFTIQNCIFSSMRFTESSGIKTYGRGYRASKAPDVLNSYATSDFVMQANPIPDLINYTKPSTDLYTDPASANFKIRDLSFEGADTAGDPRWKP